MKHFSSNIAVLTPCLRILSRLIVFYPTITNSSEFSDQVKSECISMYEKALDSPDVFSSLCAVLAESPTNSNLSHLLLSVLRQWIDLGTLALLHSFRDYLYIDFSVMNAISLLEEEALITRFLTHSELTADLIKSFLDSVTSLLMRGMMMMIVAVDDDDDDDDDD